MATYYSPTPPNLPTAGDIWINSTAAKFGDIQVFDGAVWKESDIPAAAGTLTGTTLAANVVASSLTSVGTLSSLAVTGEYLLASRTVIQQGTTSYAIPAGVRALLVECIGGGGGGGGVNSTAAGHQNVAGAGGGGGYAASFLTSLPGSPVTVQVGAGGGGGGVGNNPGSAGTDTTFNSTTVVAKGGGAGAAGADVSVVGPTNVPAAGGAAGTGDVTIPGGVGVVNLVLATTGASAWTSPGGRGSGPYGGAGGQTVYSGTSHAGGAGQNYGGGGAPAYSSDGGGQAAGGAGANGIMVIWEFK